MASFDEVNYSLRPSKSIQRQIVFDGIRTLQSRLGVARSVYIGLGSIWFTDFVMAHKLLGIDDMISMEKSKIGYSRACFNSPYATVRVRPGSSSDILPTLLDDEDVARYPWVIWLDYDTDFNESLRADTRIVIERAPGNTVFLVTFNGNEQRYGRAKDRPKRLRELFGDVVPDDLSAEECKGSYMQKTLAGLAIGFMKSVAAGSMRQGGFVPAFRVIYKDSAAMVTVGGLLPSQRTEAAAKVVEEADWKCQPTEPIVAPHLTIREAMALQSKLPNIDGLSEDAVKSLGFELEEEQLKVYEKYYREYPTFVQILTQ